MEKKLEFTDSAKNQIEKITKSEEKKYFRISVQGGGCSGFSYATFLLETSSFANFANDILPSGGGTISGIVSKDYFGDNLVHFTAYFKASSNLSRLNSFIAFLNAPTPGKMIKS